MIQISERFQALSTMSFRLGITLSLAMICAEICIVTHFREVLAICYDNEGGSAIDAKTGKIIFVGQD